MELCYEQRSGMKQQGMSGIYLSYGARTVAVQPNKFIRKFNHVPPYPKCLQLRHPRYCQEMSMVFVVYLANNNNEEGAPVPGGAISWVLSQLRLYLVFHSVCFTYYSSTVLYTYEIMFHGACSIRGLIFYHSLSINSVRLPCRYCALTGLQYSSTRVPVDYYSQRDGRGELLHSYWQRPQWKFGDSHKGMVTWTKKSRVKSPLSPKVAALPTYLSTLQTQCHARMLLYYTKTLLG